MIEGFNIHTHMRSKSTEEIKNPDDSTRNPPQAGACPLPWWDVAKKID